MLIVDVNMGTKQDEKFSQILAYVCHEYNAGDLTELKLWKLLFFCEADFFEKFGKRLTGIDFIKNTHGPTPEIGLVRTIIRNLEKNGCLEITPIQGPNGQLNKYSCPKTLGIDKLTSEELDSINQTCKKYFRLKASQLVTLSHRDPVYLAGTKQKTLDFKYALYRDSDEEQSLPKTKVKPQTIVLSKRAEESLAALFD